MNESELNYIIKHDISNSYIGVEIYKENNNRLSLVCSNDFCKECGRINIVNVITVKSYRNKGIGTIALNEFIEICKKEKFKIITGDIVTIDWNDTGPKKLKSFYEKAGFKVFLNKKLKTGLIIKRLDYD